MIVSLDGYSATTDDFVCVFMIRYSELIYAILISYGFKQYIDSMYGNDIIALEH